MTRLQQRAIELVNSRQGMKGVDLLTCLAGEFDDVTMLQQIIDLIADGELFEIEYVIPNVKSKSFIMPKGTIINIVCKSR